ncbi:hypothetical protein ACFLYE_01545 [Chloroflexota bacterium]
MKEIPFSIPVSGIVRFDEGSITITINRAETTIVFEPPFQKQKRISLEKGRTLFDVLLETAQELVRNTGKNRFSGAQLYGVALRRYPDLKRNSWTAHVIASAPNHTSQKHYGARRDYFRYLGDGTYSLDIKYLERTI